MTAIEVSHLTKEYRLGALQSLKDTALNAGRRLLGRPVAEWPLFKALDDVSFTVEPGEVLGIIGHNGAGKSTLLKMLARVSTPTRGTVKVNGRIAPLIEVGAGFVPDFTGRENVYLNGAILGMSKAEIDRKFDEIVDFAEMAEFIDTPVKRYSSGMQVKLAFAVATSVESEILIVDEVLAVGDLAFQRKCFDRMEDLIKRQGRTVVLVSHNIRQVQRLCTRAVLIDHGKVAKDGDPKTVCDFYYERSDDRIRGYSAAAVGRSQAKLSTTPAFSYRGADVLNAAFKKVDCVGWKDELLVNLRFEIHTRLLAPVFGIGIHTTDFLYLGSERSEGAIEAEALEPGMYTLVCRFRDLSLLPGHYSIRASVIAGRVSHEVFYGENLAHFQIAPNSKYSSVELRGEGFIPLDIEWALNETPTPATVGAKGFALGQE